MKLLKRCQQLPDVDVSEFRKFTSKWINYVKSSTHSSSISETDWNQFFSQTNPVAGIDRGAMQDRMKLKDGYRETNERRSFVSNWDETILPIIKDIINPDSENRIDKIKKVRDTIRNIIVQGGGRNTKAAINRILITFCPDILIRIPNEDNTKEFIELLKPFSDLGNPLIKGEDWIDNSFHIMEFLKRQLGETIQKRTLWDIYIHLKNSDYKSNMSKEKGNSNMLDKYVSLLETNKNLILTGAPGTGKTFMAKAIAAEMLGLNNLEDLEDDEQHYGFIQFHPSYDYTDFVEGLKPIEKKGQLGFKRKDGVFKVFCKNALSSIVKQNITITKEDAKAAIFIFKEKCNGKELWRAFDKGSGIFTVLTHWDAPIYAIFCVDEYSTPNPVKVSEDKIIEYLTNPQIDSYEKEEYAESIANYIKTFILDKNKKYVFIIDEINRGEISKIFGELFFSIDPGYRGKKGRVSTQYQNLIEDDDVFKKGFYVPENVYIIGTMNDIDRSVESMDFAMRRRFTWKDVTPTDTAYMLDNLDCAAEAKATMNRLNKAIEETEGLGAAYMIGPAYFLKLGKNGGDFNKLWEMNIEPLLKEYLRGFRKAKEILDKFSKAYFNQIDED